MRGFTLIEAIVYMGISTLIVTSLVSFAFMIVDGQKTLTEKSETELAGLSVVRGVENEIRTHQAISFFGFTNETIENTSVSDVAGLKNISFTINKQSFSISFYEP